jgi:hypothetical protein
VNIAVGRVNIPTVYDLLCILICIGYSRANTSFSIMRNGERVRENKTEYSRKKYAIIRIRKMGKTKIIQLKDLIQQPSV